MIRDALHAILKNDAKLQELSNGVFHRKWDPESGVGLPIIVFHKAAGTPLWAFDGPPMDKEVWVVKGVGSTRQAELIDERCKELLNGSTLTIEDRVHQDLRHISDVNYSEDVGEERVSHIGAEYKLDSEKEE